MPTLQNPIYNKSRNKIPDMVKFICPPPIYFYEIVMNFDFVPYLFSNWEIDTKGGTNTKEEGISFLTYQF